MARVLVAVLGRSRDERTGGGLRGHTVGTGIAARGHFREGIVVKSEISQHPVHLGFNLARAGARQAGEITCLDGFDGGEDVAELLIEQAVQLVLHLGPDDFRKFGKAGERFIGSLQLRELVRECRKLFAELRQLLVLQDLVFDHLPELLDVLRDVLGVDDGHALRQGRGQGAKMQANPKCRGQGRSQKHSSHQSISLIVNSMNAPSAMRALACASSSAERTRVRAACSRMRAATRRTSSARA